MKETIYKLPIPIFTTNLYVVFTDSIEKSRVKRSEILGELKDDVAGADGLNSSNNGYFYLFFKGRPANSYKSKWEVVAIFKE